MKFWPKKKWKKNLLIAILVFVTVVSSAFRIVHFHKNSDYVSVIDVLNADSSETALIIYHPGLSSFMQDVVYSFAHGLTENGWRVEITTPSSQAPTNLSECSLLVLGSPVYVGCPTPAIKRHIKRIDDLQGIGTVLLVTAGGIGKVDEAPMQQIVEEYNGKVVKVLTLFNIARNEGDGSPLDIAKQAGREIYIEE